RAALVIAVDVPLAMILADVLRAVTERRPRLAHARAWRGARATQRNRKGSIPPPACGRGLGGGLRSIASLLPLAPSRKREGEFGAGRSSKPLHAALTPAEEIAERSHVIAIGVHRDVIDREAAEELLAILAGAREAATVGLAHVAVRRVHLDELAG